MVKNRFETDAQLLFLQLPPIISLVNIRIIMQQKTHFKGMLMALIPGILGVVLWRVVWNVGYISSLVSFAVVYAMYWFYTKWGGRISKRELIQLMVVATIFILIAFFASFILDVRNFYLTMYGGEGSWFSADFLRILGEQLAHVQGYIKDLGLTLLFTGLAIFSLVHDKKRALQDKKIDKLSKTI